MGASYPSQDKVDCKEVMADELPTPMEELESETQTAEEELNQILENAPKEGDDESEELAEESPPSEETEETESTEESDQPEVEEEPEVSGEQESEPPADLSTRGQERFKELTGKLKDVSSENEQLKILVNSLQSQGYTKQQADQIAPQIDLNNSDNYAQDVTNQARIIARQEVERQRLITEQNQKVERFNEDLKEVETKYEPLNEDSPEYDAKLTGLVADLYESRSSKDPSVRLKDVVGEVMDAYETRAKEIAEKREGELRKKVASQAIPASGGKTDTETILDKLKNADSAAELAELRKQIPLGD